MMVRIDDLPAQFPDRVSADSSQPLIAEIQQQELSETRVKIQKVLEDTSQELAEAEIRLFPFGQQSKQNFIHDENELRARLQGYLEALFLKVTLENRLLQLDGRHDQANKPETLMRMATLERAISEIKGLRANTSQEPRKDPSGHQRPSNLEAVIAAICDNQREQLELEKEYFLKKNPRNPIDIIKDTLEPLVTKSGDKIKIRLEKAFLGATGQGVRELRRRYSISAKLKDISQSKKFIHDLQESFSKHNPSWYRQKNN